MTDVRPTPAAQTRAPITPKQAAAGGLGAAALVALSLAIGAIKPDEGKSNRDYLDLARVATACYGHTGPDVHVGTIRTDAQCDALLSTDAATAMRGVIGCTAALAERPQQLAAATRLAFNIGVPAFCHSGSHAAFARGQWRQGCDLMLAWDKVHQDARVVVVSGLTARRQRERAMCLVGVAA